jgi:transcription elongation factor Elf1
MRRVDRQVKCPSCDGNGKKAWQRCCPGYPGMKLAYFDCPLCNGEKVVSAVYLKKERQWLRNLRKKSTKEEVTKVRAR